MQAGLQSPLQMTEPNPPKPQITGWHEDPENPSGMRYWDGAKWGKKKARRMVPLQGGPAPPPPSTLAAERRRRRTERWNRVMVWADRSSRAGDQLVSAGKSMFWFGIALLFVVFVSIPILTHLF